MVVFPEIEFCAMLALKIKQKKKGHLQMIKVPKCVQFYDNIKLEYAWYPKLTPNIFLHNASTILV